MPNLDRSKKLLVRVALVSGSTVAALFGAQTLAMFDQSAQATERLLASTSTEAPPSTSVAIPTVEIVHQAPSVVILRSQQTSSPTGVRPATNTPANVVAAPQVILPPSPQEISAPGPIIVQQQQQQAPAVSSSSR